MSESEQPGLGRHAAGDDETDDRATEPGEGGAAADETARDETAKDDTAKDDTAKDETAKDETAKDETADDGTEEGTRQPGADPEDKEEIEQERERRLDPDNRPDEVEVDNTDRDFDPEKGMFTDAEGYEEAEPKFPAIGEQGA